MTMGPFDFSPPRKPATGLFGDMGASAGAAGSAPGLRASPGSDAQQQYAARIHASPYASPAMREWATRIGGPPSGPASPPAAASPTAPITPSVPTAASPSPAAPPMADWKLPTITGGVGQGLAHVGQSIFDGIEDKRQDTHRLGLAGALLGTGPAATEISPQQRALADALAGNPAAEAPMGPSPFGLDLGVKQPSLDDQVAGVRASLMPTASPFSFGAPAPTGLPDLSSPDGLIRAASAQQLQAGDDDHAWLLDGLTNGW